MTLRCPTCKQPSSLDSGNPWRPFCSERCRLVDLGGWLDERYSIPGEQAPTTDGDPRPADLGDLTEAARR